MPEPNAGAGDKSLALLGSATGGLGAAVAAFFCGPLLRWTLDGCSVGCGWSACRGIPQPLPAISVTWLAGHDPLRILERLREQGDQSNRSGMPKSCGPVRSERTLVGGNGLDRGGSAGLHRSIINEPRVTSFPNRVGHCTDRMPTRGVRSPSHGVGITSAGAACGVQRRQWQGARRDVGRANVRNMSPGGPRSREIAAVKAGRHRAACVRSVGAEEGWDRKGRRRRDARRS